jgi:uncharacterized OsmC-like protein
MTYRLRVERTDDGGFRATNERGAEIRIGGGSDPGVFSPLELMLVALGGCNIVTVEPLTAQRQHRLDKLAVTVTAEKVRPSEVGQITVTYDVAFPPGDDEAPQIFHDVAHRVHERHCTVSKALRQPTEVSIVLP